MIVERTGLLSKGKQPSWPKRPVRSSEWICSGLGPHLILSPKKASFPFIQSQPEYSHPISLRKIRLLVKEYSAVPRLQWQSTTSGGNSERGSLRDMDWLYSDGRKNKQCQQWDGWLKLSHSPRSLSVIQFRISKRRARESPLQPFSGYHATIPVSFWGALHDIPKNSCEEEDKTDIARVIASGRARISGTIVGGVGVRGHTMNQHITCHI